MKTFAALFGTAAIWLCTAAAAHADPLTLSGVMTVNGHASSAGAFHFTTDEFDLTGSIDGGLIESCDPCTGPTIHMGASFGSGITNAAQGTILGVSYDHLVIDAALTILAGSLPIPVGHRVGEEATLTAPFTATGRLDAGRPGTGEIVAGPGFYHALLTGSGDAVLRLVVDAGFPDTAHWRVTGGTYTFNANPAPTPEPLTVLLFAGALGLAAARYRRSSI
jgi:hypothetical protein